MVTFFDESRELNANVALRAGRDWMENFIIAVNCVLPVFITLCTGALIRRLYQVSESVFQELSVMCFRVLIPVMLFDNIYSANLSQSFDLKLMIFLFVGELLWFALGCGVAFRVEQDPGTRGAYMQSFFRSNIGIIGVAMAKTMMDSAGVATVTMAIALLAPLFNVLAVIALEMGRGGSVSVPALVRGVVKNNIVRACVLAIILRLVGVRLPEVVCGSLSNLGDAGSVLTMLALGASLRVPKTGQSQKKLLFAVLVRLVISPAVALSAAVLLGFRGNAIGTVLLTTATPLASTAYSMSVAYRSNHELTGQIVAVTSFFCCLTLMIWILLLRFAGML